MAAPCQKVGMPTTRLSRAALSVPGAEPSPRRGSWKPDSNLRTDGKWTRACPCGCPMDSGSRKGEFWAEGNLGLMIRLAVVHLSSLGAPHEEDLQGVGVKWRGEKGGVGGEEQLQAGGGKRNHKDLHNIPWAPPNGGVRGHESLRTSDFADGLFGMAGGGAAAGHAGFAPRAWGPPETGWRHSGGHGRAQRLSFRMG